jgi:hypothetical protein
MLSDMRSDCDPCEDPELDYKAALHCPCPVPEVLAHLKASIDGPGARGDEKVVFVAPSGTRDQTQRIVEEHAREGGRSDAVIRLQCVGETGKDVRAPLFLMALRIVMACGAMQRPVCVVLPAHHMGYPGSTLTVRRALRCLLQTHGGQSISAHDLEEMFANLARRLGSPKMHLSASAFRVPTHVVRVHPSSTPSTGPVGPSAPDGPLHSEVDMAGSPMYVVVERPPTPTGTSTSSWVWREIPDGAHFPGTYAVPFGASGPTPPGWMPGTSSTLPTLNGLGASTPTIGPLPGIPEAAPFPRTSAVPLSTPTVGPRPATSGVRRTFLRMPGTNETAYNKQATSSNTPQIGALPLNVSQPNSLKPFDDNAPL